VWVVLVGFWWLGVAAAALVHGEIAAGTAAVLLVAGPRLIPALAGLPSWWRAFRVIVFCCALVVWALQRWWAVPQAVVVPLGVVVAVALICWALVTSRGGTQPVASPPPVALPARRPPQGSAERVGVALGYTMLGAAFVFGAAMAHSQLASAERSDRVAEIIADTTKSIDDAIPD
jgi:hypothetical protein